MKALVTLALLSVISLSRPASADPALGQWVVYRADATHNYLGVVVGAPTPTSANVMLLAGDYFWTVQGTLYTATGTPTLQLLAAVRGPGVDQWLEATGPFVGLTPGISKSLVSSEFVPSLSLNGAAVQLSATNDVNLTVSVKIDPSLSLVGGAAGHVDLLCDSSTTPTTAVQTIGGGQTGTVVVGVALNQTGTVPYYWRVRAGDRCRLVTVNDVGTPAYTLVRQRAQVID